MDDEQRRRLRKAKRSERFFTWVWRVNGLLLLVLGLVGVAGAVALVFNAALFWSRDRPAQRLTEVAGANLSEQNLRLGTFRPIAGSPFLYARLAPFSDYIRSGSKGGLGAAHNLLFFDTGTKKAHWLLPDNERIIRSYSFLLDPPDARCEFGETCKRDQKAVALLLELQEPENVADAESARSLAIASPAGRDLTPIVQSTGGLLGHHQSGADSVLVFYVSGGAARVLDVDVISHKTRSDAPLSTTE